MGPPDSMSCKGMSRGIGERPEMNISSISCQWVDLVKFLIFCRLSQPIYPMTWVRNEVIVKIEGVGRAGPGVRCLTTVTSFPYLMHQVRETFFLILYLIRRYTHQTDASEQVRKLISLFSRTKCCRERCFLQKP